MMHHLLASCVAVPTIEQRQQLVHVLQGQERRLVGWVSDELASVRVYFGKEVFVWIV